MRKYRSKDTRNKMSENKFFENMSEKFEPVQMKIFRINQNDFVAAPSKESAIEWYEETGGMIDNLIEINPEIHAMWYPSGMNRSNQIKMTFKEVLEIENKNYPYLIDQIN